MVTVDCNIPDIEICGNYSSTRNFCHHYSKILKASNAVAHTGNDYDVRKSTVCGTHYLDG